MHILVNGTAVVEWGSEEPYESDGANVAFEVDDGGYLGTVPPGEVPHWDGISWWSVPEEPSPSDLSDAISDVAELAASNEVTLDEVVDAVMELASLIGGE